MILDKIENAALYLSLNPGFEKAFDFINKNDFSNFLPGKYDIAGDEIFVLVNEYETKNAQDSYPEAHKKYIDIQLLISGTEKIGFASFIGQKVVTEYNETKDISFFDAPVDFFQLKTRMFAIFFNSDLHQPGIYVDMPEMVKKVVVKVLKNYSEK